MKDRVSIETYLRFLRHYLLGIIYTCHDAKTSSIQLDLVESYAKLSLDLINELRPDNNNEINSLEITDEF